MKIYAFILEDKTRLHAFFRLLFCTMAIVLLAGSTSAHANIAQDIKSPDADPDLVISDVWSNGSLICYQAYNMGDAATKEFTNGLQVDGQTVAIDPAPALKAGGRYDGCFKYTWTCSYSQDTITVSADVNQNIPEANENNNTRSETWLCDQAPPKITSGPSVSEITTNSAKISWTTDESSSGLVKYDVKTNSFSLYKGSQQPVATHQFDLTDLKPATLYQFKVISADLSGNEVESKPGFFRTLPKSDITKPALSNFKSERLPGEIQRYRFFIDAQDNDQIERVEFRLDGELIGTDYAPAPDDSTRFEWDVNPSSLGMTMAEFDKDHLVEIIAHDRLGNSMSYGETFHPPFEALDGELEFLYMGDEYDYYIEGSNVPINTFLPLSVHASLYDFDCSFSPVHGTDGMREICSHREVAVDYVEFFFNSSRVGTYYPSNASDLTYEHDLDISGRGVGSYTVIAVSHAGDLSRQVRLQLNILTGSADLDIERTLTEDGHQFRVGLSVRNSGTASARLYALTDNLDGLQPIIKSSTYYTVTSSYNSSEKRNTVDIDLHQGLRDSYTLEPGHHLDLEYLAVPVLYRDVDAPDYVAGADPVELDYSDGTRMVISFDLETSTTSTDHSLLSEIEDIQADSDYLVVTNPCNLFAVNASATAVNLLLSGVAKLAEAKDGALAYLVGSPSADTVDDAIETWGNFMKGSDGVANHFRSNGYLLLVGETDIIPAFSRHLEPPWYVSWLDHVTIDPTDVYYADTSGNTIDPELNLGRVPGNSADKLLIPIETITKVTDGSSGYDFDWSDALVVSGWPETRSGGSDHIDFAAERNAVEDRLDDHVTNTTELNNTTYATREDARDAFFAQAPGTDIIHLAGHGNRGGLDDLGNSDFDAYDDPFGSANPFVYASSCLTGDYTAIHGLAEKFLQKGAGLYLGSTEVSYCCTNTSIARHFYNDWDPGEAVGPVLKSIKRDIGGFHADNWATGYYEDIWTVEYHLLGDPEYGAGAYAGTSPEPALPALPVESPSEVVPVSIPAYVLEKTDLGKNLAEIPGGSFVMMPGQPMVPSYSAVYLIPAGTVVQDVSLSSRTGMQTAWGIDLVTFNPAEAGENLQPLLPEAEEEWFPNADFDWGVQTNPDGTSELHIVIYPFFYNALTQEVNFYKEYQFDVTTVSSSVSIPLLDTNAPVYDPGDTVFVDLVIHNSGNPETVAVSAAVYALGSYELVDGLLMDTLQNLSNTATFALEWDSSQAEAGDYYLVVELHDLEGHLLDTKTEPFSLGIVSGQSSNLVAPDHFKIGDSVGLSFDFQNTGTMPISGTAVIRIEGLSGGFSTELNLPVNNLQPLAVQHLSTDWDTLGIPLDDYHVTAYILFEGQTTPALTKIMETTWKLRLPIIQK